MASERVEIVILEPMNTDGQPHETRLWIVDDPDYQYLPTSADAGWHQPLVANPHIRVERNGQRRAYVAVPGPGETHRSEPTDEFKVYLGRRYHQL